MEKFKEFIKKYELISFFVLTFLISWIIWVVSFFVKSGSVLNIISLLGAFGPALAAIALAGFLDSQKNNNKITKFLILSGILFLLFFGLNILSIDAFLKISKEVAVYIVLGIMALICAFIFSGAFFNNKGIENLLKPIYKWKISFKWYFMSFLLLPTLVVVSLLIDVLLLKGTIDFSAYKGPWHKISYNILVSFFAIMLFGGPLNEEPGWRGFAMPRLLNRFNPLVASLILGLVWSLWHAPLHFNGFYAGGIAGFLSRFIWNTPLTIFFTWIYMKTKGSLIHVTLLHTIVNSISLFFPISSNAGLILIIMLVALLVYIIIKNKMWKKTTYDNT